MKHLFIVLVVLLVISIALTAENPKDRLQIKRQLSTYVYTFPINNVNHRLIETKVFNYDTVNQGLINSIAIHETEEYFWDQTGWYTSWDYATTYNYESTYSNLNGLFDYQYDTDISPHGFQHVHDSVYRMIKEEFSFVNYAWINRHFNQTSGLDSLKFQLSNADPFYSYYTLYTPHYATGHTYADSLTCYTVHNNIITNTTFYSLNYGTTLTTHPVPLHMHEAAYLGAYTPYGNQFNYFNTPVLGDLLFLSAVLDPIYQVASFTNLSTSQVQSITYEQDTTGYHISIGNKELWFDNDGYFIRCYNTVWEAPYYAEKILEITWDTVVANDDDVQPISSFLVVTSPNPFRQYLSIKLNNKESVPSDIIIYNIKGQLVRSWKDVKTAELIWDGNDKHNNPVGGGIYLIKAKQGNNTSIAKAIKF